MQTLRAPVRLLVALVLTLVAALVLQFLRAFPDPGWSLANAVRGVFGYVGESAAPYLLVPFAVGRLARARLVAALSGVASCCVLVAAYYGWFLPGSMTAARGGPGEHAFWLTAAVGAGAVSGLLGRASAGSSAWGLAMPIALVLEPVGWFVILRLGIAPVLASPWNAVGAIVEAALGVLWIGLVVVARRRREVTRGTARGPAGTRSASPRGRLRPGS